MSGHARAAVLCCVLAAAGCGGETTGNVDYGVEPGAAAPTTGEDADAAYAVLSCDQIAGEQAALAAVTPPAPGTNGASDRLRQRSAALERLAATKSCTARTGQVAGSAAPGEK